MAQSRNIGSGRDLVYIDKNRVRKCVITGIGKYISAYGFWRNGANKKSDPDWGVTHYRVRFCDDFVIGLREEEDARRELQALYKRFKKDYLELHPQKTRLINFRISTQQKKSSRKKAIWNLKTEFERFKLWFSRIYSSLRWIQERILGGLLNHRPQSNEKSAAWDERTVQAKST